MTKVTTGSRKDDHIRINLEENVGFNTVTTGLEKIRFEHRALPELDLEAIDLSTEFLGKPLGAPILISSMTGGTAHAKDINRNLALAAEEMQIAMGLGSMRIVLEEESSVETFALRKYAPTALLFANLGAVQLNYGYNAVDCMRLIEVAEADALILHFNVLQEAVQPEGDTNFSDLIRKTEAVCTELRKHGIPVIAKEVGWGFSAQDARNLVNAGISAIDVAGAGGTSWSQVEMYRAQTELQRNIAATFVDWGISTTEAIANVQAADPTLPIIASGGLRNGLDIAKTIALGANIGGMAGPFLRAAIDSADAVNDVIWQTIRELQITMLCTGCADLDQLARATLVR